MTCVLKLEGLVNGPPTEYDGSYLAAYDPGWGEPGDCLLETVAQPDAAKQFADFEAARQEWMRVDPRQPRRPDGRPNRPLTAYSVSIETLRP